MSLINSITSGIPIFSDDSYMNNDINRFSNSKFHMIMSIIITLTVLYIILLIKLDHDDRFVLY